MVEDLLFCDANQLTETQAKRHGQFVGNLDSNRNFAQFYRADISPMDIRTFGKHFLGQSYPLPLAADSMTERPTCESICLRHIIFLVS